MCFGDDPGSSSSSQAAGSATSNVSFNPTITIGGNGAEPAQDTTSAFTAKLLATPPVSIPLPAPVALEPNSNSNKVLTFLAVALVARKVIHG